MPRYDYQCERGHRYEKQESFGAPAQQTCEKCGAPANRQFGAPSIVFKGSLTNTATNTNGFKWSFTVSDNGCLNTTLHKIRGGFETIGIPHGFFHGFKQRTLFTFFKLEGTFALICIKYL